MEVGLIIAALYDLLKIQDSFGKCLNFVTSGSGDGSVGLFDVRTSGAIARLPLTSNWEVCPVVLISAEACR